MSEVTPVVDETIELKKKDVEEKSEEPKVEPVPEASPELLEKLKSQVEFYFGDVNMQRDKFLTEQAKLDEGWIPMAVMLNFKLLAAISKDIPTILKAIEDSDLMEISEDKKKIRRRLDKPLPIYDDKYREAQTARTLYVKGFPTKNIEINMLKEFFQNYEIIENIVMRKYKDSDKQMMFKGSVFVQFKTLDGAKAFLARESVKYEGQELIKMFSTEYTALKEKEREEKKPKSGGKAKNNEKMAENGGDNDEKSSLELPKGSVLKFTGASDTTNWDAIKSKLGDLDAKIAFVDYKIGATHGLIRLQEPDSAKPLLEKMSDNKVTIDGSEVTFELLEGEAEEEYLKKAKNDIVSRKQKMFKGKSGRGRKGRGNHSQGKKRAGSPLKSEVASKKVASN